MYFFLFRNSFMSWSHLAVNIVSVLCKWLYTQQRNTHTYTYIDVEHTRAGMCLCMYMCAVLHSYDGSPVNSPAALVLRSYHSLTHAHHTFNSRHNAYTHTARRPQLLVALP